MAMDDDFQNAVVHGIQQKELVLYLSSLEIDAFVSATINNCTAFYLKKWVEIGPLSTPTLLPEVSAHFKIHTLKLEIFNEVVLDYELYKAGILIDAYNSFPDYAAPDKVTESDRDIEVHAKHLCAAFNEQSSIGLVSRVLERSSPFSDARQRCKALAASLNIPIEFIGLNYFILEDNVYSFDKHIVGDFATTTFF